MTDMCDPVNWNEKYGYPIHLFDSISICNSVAEFEESCLIQIRELRRIVRHFRDFGKDDRDDYIMHAANNAVRVIRYALRKSRSKREVPK